MKPAATYPAQRHQSLSWLRKKSRLYAKHAAYTDEATLSQALSRLAEAEGLRLEPHEIEDEARKALDDLRAVR